MSRAIFRLTQQHWLAAVLNKRCKHIQQESKPNFSEVLVLAHCHFGWRKQGHLWIHRQRKPNPCLIPIAYISATTELLRVVIATANALGVPETVRYTEDLLCKVHLTGPYGI